MKNAIIIHGSCDADEYFDDQYPSLSNSHWLPWLQKQLLIKNIPTQTPEMPKAYDSEFTYEEWKTEFEQYPISNETILVGHSTGGGFLVKWLSLNQQPIAQLVLVAPFMDPTGRKTNSFYSVDLDQSVLDRVNRIDLFVSKDDPVEGVAKSVEIIVAAWPNISLHEFTDHGHFTEDDMGAVEFSELLEIIIIS